MFLAPRCVESSCNTIVSALNLVHDMHSKRSRSRHHVSGAAAGSTAASAPCSSLKNPPSSSMFRKSSLRRARSAARHASGRGLKARRVASKMVESYTYQNWPRVTRPTTGAPVLLPQRLPRLALRAAREDRAESLALPHLESSRTAASATEPANILLHVV